MRYQDSSGLHGWRRFAFIAYVIFGLILLPLTFLVSTAAGCPAFAPPSCEPASDLKRYLIFPGASFTMLFAGVILHGWLKRNQN